MENKLKRIKSFVIACIFLFLLAAVCLVINLIAYKGWIGKDVLYVIVMGIVFIAFVISLLLYVKAKKEGTGNGEN